MGRLKAPQRREQLIEVATRLFAEHGYEATTTAAIAHAARVTEPILYRHFKSKHDLFVAIVNTVTQQTLEHWRELVVAIPNPADKIRFIAESFAGEIDAQANAYNVIHGALATSHDRKVLAAIRNHYANVEAFFISIIREGQELGIFRSDLDPRIPAWMMINNGVGYAMIVLNLADFEQLPIREAVEFTLRGMTGETSR